MAARSGRYREIFFGGAGGGGKSDAMLMLAIQDDWIANPGYSALILRKTFSDLNQAEGILNRAQSWLIGQPGVEWQAQHNRFVFGSGAILQFGHCHNSTDHLKYRGGKYNLVCWDELTDFPENQYTFLFSRQRRPSGSDLPLLTVSASNPGGKGHEWVRERLVRTKAPDRFFLPALFTDNPHLDQAEYAKTLDMMLPTERARVKYGDWDVVDGVTLFDRAWLSLVDKLPDQPRVSCRFWDCAATPGGGDYSVGLRVHKIDNHFYNDHMVRGQFGPADLDRIIRETVEMDGHEVAQVFEVEPGSAGKRVMQYLRQLLAGYKLFEDRPTGDKYVRALPAARHASNGRVHLVKGPHVGAVIEEVCAFTGKPGDKHDDIVDTLSGAVNFLGRRQGGAIG